MGISSATKSRIVLPWGVSIQKLKVRVPAWWNGRHKTLKMSRFTAYRFESGRGYHKKENKMTKKGTTVPTVTFKTRVRDENISGDNPFRWQDMKTDDYFNNKRVVIFSLPGAFTPTCSTYQLPGFENNAQAFYDKGIDDIYCISVNDSFVMNKWAQMVRSEGLQNVKVIPDGNGEFTLGMDMLIDKTHLGFGKRSWRYAAVVDNGVITHWFEEPGINNDGSDTDPYGETSPENVLKSL